MKKTKPKDRTPEIVARYRASVTFKRAADTLLELLTAGLSEHDCRDAVRMAVELQGWSMLDRMRSIHGDDAIPADPAYRHADVLPMDDVPEAVTACRANLPQLLSMRTDPDARVAARRSITILKGYERP